MRVESMASRLDFDERRARSLEGVVQYRPGAVPPLQPPAAEPGRGPQRQGNALDNDGNERRSRRRRRRGRRRGPDDRGAMTEGTSIEHGAPDSGDRPADSSDAGRMAEPAAPPDRSES
jgi:hypothetical protein